MLDTRMTVKLACCMALALGSAAMAAQQRGTAVSEGRGDLDEIRKVSTLIGTPVMNRANTKVAEVRDLVLSPGGDVLYAVLGHGGVGGIGETETAAPFDALEVRHANGKWAVNLDMNAEALKQAPTIQSENDREFTDAAWVARVHQFFRPRGESKVQPELGGTPAQREPRAVEWVILATKIRASKLKNLQNEDMGKVEDLLLDRTHRVNFLIIGRGGVLGVGGQDIPVPWSRLTLSTNAERAAVTAAIDATKAQLDMAPLVKGDNYATLLAPGFADEVRRYFGAIGHGANTGASGERR